jgi:hypothetical protein
VIKREPKVLLLLLYGYLVQNVIKNVNMISKYTNIVRENGKVSTLYHVVDFFLSNFFFSWRNMYYNTTTLQETKNTRNSVIFGAPEAWEHLETIFILASPQPAFGPRIRHPKITAIWGDGGDHWNDQRNRRPWSFLGRIWPTWFSMYYHIQHSQAIMTVWWVAKRISQNNSDYFVHINTLQKYIFVFFEGAFLCRCQLAGR